MGGLLQLSRLIDAVNEWIGKFVKILIFKLGLI